MVMWMDVMCRRLSFLASLGLQGDWGQADSRGQWARGWSVAGFLAGRAAAVV